MRYKISQKDYDKIEELVKCALSAYNKAEANKFIQAEKFYRGGCTQ